MKSKKRKIHPHRRSHRVEVSLKNFVDKDVQSMLLPLNLMQMIQFYPKYRIKNNVITPNSRLSNLVSICVTIFYITVFIYEFYHMYEYTSPNNIFASDNTALFYHNIDKALFCLGYWMNFFISYFYTKENIVFVLTFQEIHRYLNNTNDFKNFIVCNWFTVILFIALYICSDIFFCIMLRTEIHHILSIAILLTFDTNIVYAIRLIQLLKDKVDLWNIRALQCRSMEYRNMEDYCEKMLQAYVNILHCFDNYKVSFQPTIALYFMTFFCEYLVKIQIFLMYLNRIASRNSHISVYFITLLLTFLILKPLALQIALTLHCEKFYIAMMKVQDSCALILNSNCTDTEKKLCKNVKRLHRATFDKMDACRIFYVDATLSVKIIVLCANYTFVLLQFAFL